MQASIISFVLAFAATHVAAQNQSAPFNLVLSSANATLNGSLLDACHEGAAIEGLCLGAAPTDSYAQYNLNYTSQDPSSTQSPIPGTIGILVCTFPMNTPKLSDYDTDSNSRYGNFTVETSTSHPRCRFLLIRPRMLPSRCSGPGKTKRCRLGSTMMTRCSFRSILTILFHHQCKDK